MVAQSLGAFRDSSVVLPKVCSPLIQPVLLYTNSIARSGWDSLPYGYCRSSIAPALSAGYNSACYEGFPESAFVTVHTVEGERVSDTDGLISLLPSITYTTETVALTEQWSDPSLVASMVIARQFPAIAMIYKSEDVKAAKNGSKDDADDDKDGKAKDNDNAASTLSKVGGVVSGVALLV